MTMTTTTTYRQTSLCTCCNPPRPMHRDIDYVEKDFGSPGEERYFESHPDWESNQEWAHDDDEIFASSAHIHVDACSRDCDGTYDRSNVYLPSHIDGCEDHNHLWDHIARNVLPLSVSGDDQVDIRIWPGRAQWGKSTDEGHDSGEMRLCLDPSCAYERSTFRDHTAESMGY